MPFIARKSLLAMGVLSGVALVAAAGFVWSGVYDIGADDTHTRPVHSVLQALRERSIEVRAGKLQVPADLADPARIRQGAGNYNAMCTGCHLGPGLQATELSKGLYPAPPDLSKATVDAAEAFWTIKHGIKASGMPAWGRSMDDGYIWNMAAFLQALPKLDAAQYQALVASSGGHSHGGGETGGDPHPPETGDRHHDDHADPEGEGAGNVPDAHAMPAPGSTHVHADGKRHEHSATNAPSPTPHPPPATAAPVPDAPATADAHDANHRH